ncbi:malonyl-CoA O-methyltransferase [Roseateles sp. YR242]|uniref:biotin synthase n=1 Tax=Roseateles sp. YR242 TaxID=1855305 RepID=UPI0008BAEAC5|nr:biotin synthase [Roseateles sp. YR242]SEK58810.1 malonyl-CoA O-methyltransferase [Roseateles sp. YR242]
MSGNEAKPPGTQQIDAAAARRQRRRLALADQPPWLYQEVAQRMLERLPVIKLQPAQVLQRRPSVGGGDAGLRQQYPQATQVWCEPDDRVRAQLQQRFKRGWIGSVAQSVLPSAMQTMMDKLRGTFTPELVAQAPAGASQLLWSNMELHAETDKPALIHQWHDALAVDGFLMFSCFGPDSFIELRPLYEREGLGVPTPEWVDMHDLGDMLVHAGFADPVMDQEHLRLTWGTPDALLADLRALGGNVSVLRGAGLRSRAWRQRLLAALESLRGADGRLGLSVELVYGHAFKPQPRLKMAAQTAVSLDQMRAMVRGQGKH